MPERRSIRLKEYDYSRPGGYYITLCTYDRRPSLGFIQEQRVFPSDLGSMVDKWWNNLSSKLPGITTDTYTIMPNHIHGIIRIGPVGADPRVDPQTSGAPMCAPLHKIIQWFKTMTTNECLRMMRSRGTSDRLKLWQRNYYEHIIRNEDDLMAIRQYITDNPAKWPDDPENRPMT